MGRSKGVAFFDVDGTLLRIQSGLSYVSYLRRRGLMSRADQLRLMWGFVTYRLGIVNLERMAEVTSRWLDGRLESEILEHCRDWYHSDVRQEIRPELVNEIDRHKREGRLVALLTGGTRYLNDVLAGDIGVEHVIGTELEVIEGRFTGRAVPPFCYGRGKVKKARAFVEEQGVDLSDSYFYTDSISDLPMLECVSRPVVVKPDPRLRVEAKRRGWPVFDTAGDSRPGPTSPGRRAGRTRSD